MRRKIPVMAAYKLTRVLGTKNFKGKIAQLKDAIDKVLGVGEGHKGVFNFEINYFPMINSGSVLELQDLGLLIFLRVFLLSYYTYSILQSLI